MRPRKPAGPEIPDDITGKELDRAVRDELLTLPGPRAADVARHLVCAGRLLDDDPELAHAHALAARRLAPRLGAVREAVGMSAYLCGRYAESLAELRAARRLSGTSAHLPVLADCERGLGRPRQALEIAGSAAASALDLAEQIEMRIVAAGARRDLGQLDAAVVTLQIPALSDPRPTPENARLRYAYADALQAAGRSLEAKTWFQRASEIDEHAQTGASERLEQLDGMSFLDLLDEDESGGGGSSPQHG